MKVTKAVLGSALGLVLVGSSLSYARELSTPQEVEIKRLGQLLKEKNGAIDLSIAEIKRLQGNKPAVMLDNPFLGAAYDSTGWETVHLNGLLGVSVKPIGGDTIVRVPMSSRTAAMDILSARSRALFHCGGMQCFVLPSSLLKPAEL